MITATLKAAPGLFAIALAAVVAAAAVVGLLRYNLELPESNLSIERQEEALALKARFKPGDSVVDEAMVVGDYSGLHVIHQGHWSWPIHVFFEDEPTVIRHERVIGPPPGRKNPEDSLKRRIREKAAFWRKGYVPAWKRYVPEVLPLNHRQTVALTRFWFFV